MTEKETLYFIQPHVLDRLVSGKFVPARKQVRSVRMDERRDLYSPLNVTRRAIRYEPLVFSTRLESLTEAAHALNDPGKKLFLIRGNNGRGKTTFARGLVELMGGGQEQLLWFDVSQHTDFDEVIRFLVEYMIYVCQTRQDSAAADPPSENPIETLDHLLQQATDLPILLVIDNLEHLVAPDNTIRSQELKEAFNFLLSFPNIKLMLLGRLLPIADMNPNSSSVYHLALDSLGKKACTTLVQQIWKQRTPPKKLPDTAAILPALQGEPLFLTIFAKLLHRHPEPEQWLSQDASDPAHTIVSLVQNNLSPEEFRFLTLMSLIRHGGTLNDLHTMITHCDPSLRDFNVKGLDRSYIRLLLKKVYPPQHVLEQLRQRQEDQSKHTLIEAHYRLAETFQTKIAAALTDAERLTIHERLEAFYTREKNKHITQRMNQTRTQHLVSEAQHHRNMARRMKITTTMPTPTVDITPSGDSFNIPQAYPSDISHPPQPAEEDMLLDDAWDTSTSPTLEEGYPVQGTIDLKRIAQESFELETEDTTHTIRLSDEDIERLATLLSEGIEPANGKPLQADNPNPSEALPPTDIDSPKDPVDQTDYTLQKHLAKAVTSHNRHQIIEALVQLALHRLSKKLVDNAEACLLKALDFAMELGEAPVEASVRNSLGLLYQQHFRHKEALTQLTHVKTLLHQAPTPNTILAEAHGAEGEILLYRHDLDRAIVALTQALSYSKNKSPYQARILFKLALTHDELGNLEDASTFYQRSFNLSQALKDYRACGACLYNLGSLYLDIGNTTRAEQTLTQCLDFDRKANNTNGEFRTLMLLTTVFEDNQAFEQVEKTLELAEQVASHANNPTALASVKLKLGSLAETNHNWSRAETLYKQANEVAKSLSKESQRLIQQKLHAIQEHLS